VFETIETELLESTKMKEKRMQDKPTDKIFAAKTTDEIIAIMKEEVEDEARQKILEKMTPACLEKLRYIETWFHKEIKHTLRSRYELGLQVQELYEDDKKGGKLYGRNAIGRICKILHWDEGLIRHTLRFVQTYSPEELEQLCERILPTGAPLTWSHVRVLLSAQNRNQRQELLASTITEGWTCTELAQKMKNLYDGQTKDNLGRPPRMPKDFDGAVAQQQQSAEQWDRLFTRVWAKRDRSLVAQAAKLPKDEVTEERLRQARELAYYLHRVANQATEQAEKAEQVVKDFDRILDERQQAEKPSAPATKTRRRTA
jgi:hypothetical protein